MPKETIIDRLIARKMRKVAESGPDKRFEFAKRSILQLRSNPTVLTEGVEATLQYPVTSPSDEVWKTLVGATLNMRIMASELLTPRWMSKKGLVTAVGELSSSALWEKVLQNLPRTEEDTAAIGGEEINVGEVAKMISLNDSTFITSAIVLGLLAAADGKMVKYIPRSSIHLLNTDFARAIGERYSSRAGSYEEFDERLQELVPNPDTSDSFGGNTLFHELSQHQAFTGPRGRKCPSRYITLLTLQQWGRQLDTAIYKERFKQTITR